MNCGMHMMRLSLEMEQQLSLMIEMHSIDPSQGTPHSLDCHKQLFVEFFFFLLQSSEFITRYLYVQIWLNRGNFR